MDELLDSEPLVSILVPVYNVDEYIERCARSVLGQTYRNLEFVFVDDGCTDDSIDILERVINDFPHLQQRIRVIHNEKNRGLSAARNTLVYNSTGEFVYHVDSDDWLEPIAVEKLVRKQRETDADIVMGQWVDYRPNGLVVKANPIGHDLDPRSFLEVCLSFDIFVAQWNRLIRRSLYIDNHISWDENMWREDYTPFFKIYYYAKSSAFVEDVIYNYERRRKSSIVVSEVEDTALCGEMFYYDNAIAKFFSDKGTSLSEKAAQYSIRKKRFFLLKYLSLEKKKAYCFIVSKIEKETDRSLWPVIGWDTPFVHFIESHYHIHRLKKKCGRMKWRLLSFCSGRK